MLGIQPQFRERQAHDVLNVAPEIADIEHQFQDFVGPVPAVGASAKKPMTTMDAARKSRADS